MYNNRKTTLFTFTAPLHSYVNHSNFLVNNNIRRTLIVLAGECKNIDGYNYRFNLGFGQENGSFYFRFECEAFRLSYWTPKNIKKLCKEHIYGVRNQKAFEKEINSIVEICKTTASYHKDAVLSYVESFN